MPLTTSDAPDLTNKGIKKVYIKNMPHTGDYIKKEIKVLRRKGIKAGTEKAHKAIQKKPRKILTDSGYMLV